MTKEVNLVLGFSRFDVETVQAETPMTVTEEAPSLALGVDPSLVREISRGSPSMMDGGSAPIV